jgi:hypothetical protein
VAFKITKTDIERLSEDGTIWVRKDDHKSVFFQNGGLYRAKKNGLEEYLVPNMVKTFFTRENVPATVRIKEVQDKWASHWALRVDPVNRLPEAEDKPRMSDNEIEQHITIATQYGKDRWPIQRKIFGVNRIWMDRDTHEQLQVFAEVQGEPITELIAALPVMLPQIWDEVRRLRALLEEAK